jgi:antirestriction protein
MIDNTQDVIDSREVIERIAELEAIAEDGDSLLDPGERIELMSLKELADEASGASDWQYGEALIRDSYFKTYAQELADELDTAPAQTWPYTCIDWEQAARELQQDYTSVDFGFVTYWVRW